MANDIDSGMGLSSPRRTRRARTSSSMESASRRSAAGIPAKAAEQGDRSRRACYVIPGGIDAHTHLDMPFGGTTSADDFETGTRAAAFGGTTTIVDFAIQARGTRMRAGPGHVVEEGRGPRLHRLRPAHDHHRPRASAGLEDMDDMVREGVASFKLFMAYPNVLMVDDATIFKALSQTAKNGALICMHAENGSVIDVIVARALAEGKTAPIYHALTRPPRAEAEAVHRAIAMAEIAAGARLHRAPLLGGRAERGAGGARPRRAGLCRDLPAVPAALPGRACPARTSKARSTCSRRRCGPRSTSPSSGTA